MNLLSRSILFITLLLLFDKVTYAQAKADSTMVGEVRGIVRDSVHNYDLPLASIAIYRVKDSTLVSYQLSNTFGEFKFEKMPVNVQLRIMVSYVGYKNLGRTFIIPKKIKYIDLKDLVMYNRTTELKGVVVKYVPPVRMNHDTLEFNADAFDLDKNAVVEDLLRKLPHLTVWGDGSITVNGKLVKQVLVNGKPFFGGDNRIAIENIPKNAVDKIQVYREQQNKQNLLDSATTLNIKLKKDKSAGLFGKISTGYGTERRYENDVDLNFFNKQTQWSIAGAANNTNKMPDDVSTLLRNSTYKGIGASIEYQPDFRLAGVNQSKFGGIVFTHDFIPNANYNNTNRVTAEYLIKKNLNVTNTDLQTISTLGANNIQTQQISSQIKVDTATQQLKTSYERHKLFIKIDANANFRTTDNHAESSRQTSIYGSSGALQSTNKLNDTAVSSGENILFNLNINKEKDGSKMSYLPGNWRISYSFDGGNRRSDQTKVSSFSSVAAPSQDQTLNRLYNNNGKDYRQQLNSELGDFSGLLFGDRGFLGISVSLKNDLEFATHKEDNLVSNKDSAGIYRADPYLTGKSKLIIFDEQPALVLTKSFLRELANRYNKFASLNFTIQEQLYGQKNSSTYLFQNFEKNYQKFLPGVSFVFSNDQYGSFSDNFTLSLSTLANYPTVNQLHPIVDSINQSYIVLGNPKLSEAIEHRLSFELTHTSQRTKNTFGYRTQITAGIINNSFADSSITDNLGRSRHFTVNVSRMRYVNVLGSLNKAFKFNEHQLQIQLSPSISFTHSPIYVNNVLNFSNTISGNNSLSLLYTVKDWWALELKESLFYYHSLQKGSSDIEFNNSTISTEAAATLNCTKRLRLGSNISGNTVTSTGSKTTDFIIWNADATYRMLKGNNLELKFAALDLLRQNTGIINEGMNNSITRGTTNVLRQYFMLSLAYYPRQFGRQKKQAAAINE